ncbi:ATP-dependent DNA helicase II subunit 2 [Xylographa opegraphella]|nr:ATP-dependent DNA helicase II subunit 2 [Xylographa opegraphella]
MADKEATVYIVDVGSSMGRKNQGRQQSDLEWVMLYVWDKITSTVGTDRKTATLGVIGLHTVGTANELAEEESFANISVFQDIKQTLLPDLQRLRSLIRVSKTNDGDAISAIVLAIEAITKYCKKLKYRRNIVLVTNGHGSMDTDDLSEITSKIKEDNIELTILGVGFDDAEYGFKEEDKGSEKTKHEAILKTLADSCDGIFGTLAQAIEELGIPRLKMTRPVNSYKGQLTLGDPEHYDTAFSIDVERYPRTMIRRPASASQYVHRTDLSNRRASVSSSTTILPDADAPEGESSNPNTNGLAAVRNARSYQVEDDTAPGGKRDVTRDELAKGYEYGRTAVHISESDESITNLETAAVLEIVGFIPKDNYDRYMSMSSSNVIIAQKTNSKAIIALSSLIHALMELEYFAIARLVPKANKAPVLVLLAPSIEVHYECLLDVQIPFAEDVRSYKFAPLDRIITVSGKILKEHRNLPNEALSSAMSDYVDSLDLSSFGRDDDGKPMEYMQMTDTFSSVLHRIDQAVRWRAVHPEEPIPPPYDILTKFTKIPDELEAGSKLQLVKLREAANVKKVPPKLRSRKRQRDRAAPLSGLDVSALLATSRSTSRISPDNPIPEFRQMLETTEDPNGIVDAASQLINIIEKHIKDSFGDSNYDRVIAEMAALRQEMTEMEEPGLWNDWLKNLKERLKGNELGAGRDELWWRVRKDKLGLIVKSEMEVSDIGDDEAKQFLSR